MFLMLGVLKVLANTVIGSPVYMAAAWQRSACVIRRPVWERELSADIFPARER